MLINVSENPPGKWLRLYQPRAHTERFICILNEWGIETALIESMVITIQITEMFDDATVLIGSDNNHTIYLNPRIFEESQEEINKRVAHELRHLWHGMRLGLGLVWEWEEQENECTRMEEKYKDTNFLVCGFSQ